MLARAPRLAGQGADLVARVLGIERAATGRIPLVVALRAAGFRPTLAAMAPAKGGSRAKKLGRTPAERLSIAELGADASRAVRRVREAKRPIVITDRGRPAAVLVTPQEFERMREHDRFVEAVREGLADSDAGRVFEDAAVIEEVEAALARPERP